MTDSVKKHPIGYNRWSADYLAHTTTIDVLLIKCQRPIHGAAKHVGEQSARFGLWVTGKTC